MRELPVSGLFFAIGHEPATKFLDGQLKLDHEKYIVTEPGGHSIVRQTAAALHKDAGAFLVY